LLISSYYFCTTLFNKNLPDFIEIDIMTLKYLIASFARRLFACYLVFKELFKKKHLALCFLIFFKLTKIPFLISATKSRIFIVLISLYVIRVIE
jgi:hypothetical protein